MLKNPVWVELSNENMNDEFYLTCLLLSENKELLNEKSPCNGSCASGTCKY